MRVGNRKWCAIKPPTKAALNPTAMVAMSSVSCGSASIRDVPPRVVDDQHGHAIQDQRSACGDKMLYGSLNMTDIWPWQSGWTLLGLTGYVCDDRCWHGAHTAHVRPPYTAFVSSSSQIAATVGMAAATGKANRIPMIPSSLPPMRTARSVTRGRSCSVRLNTRGEVT